MGKKMKFPFLFKSKDSSTAAAAAAASPWPWPACVNNRKTISFRAKANTTNAAAEHSGGEEFFTCEDDDDAAAVIRDLKSDRLFFKPGETSSILEELKPRAFPFVTAAVDSDDPVLDFRASMEEMVAAHDLRSWECLEELLMCYLRVNGESNHRHIVDAFVELLVRIDPDSAPPPSSAIDERCSSSSTTTNNSLTSPLSFSFASSSTCSSTTPSSSQLESEDGVAAAESGGGESGRG